MFLLKYNEYSFRVQIKKPFKLNGVKREWIPPQSDSFEFPLSHIFFFAPQSQEMLSNLESASVRIVKPPQPPSSSGGRTAPSSLPPHPQQLNQVGASPAASSSSSTQAPGLSCVPTPDSAGGLRMATIQEDTSSDSHQGEEGLSDDFTTAGAYLSATKSSYEDLTEQNQPARQERRRLKRQECIDTKETECWEQMTTTDSCFREHAQTHLTHFSYHRLKVLKSNSIIFFIENILADTRCRY